MGIGVSIFLLAVGAILAFAVDVTTSGINLNTVGIILMVVGGFGVLLSLAFWSSWGGWSRGGDTYVVDGPRETTTVERQVRR